MSLLLYPQPNEDEKKVRDATRDIINQKLRPFSVEDDEKHFFRREIFTDFAKLGFTAMTVPKEYGGSEKSFRCYYAFLEEIARGGMAISVAVGVTNLVQGALLQFGTVEQKKKYLTKLTSGELMGAFSLSEPGSGSDAASLKCAAKPVSGGYRVTGNKVWCSNAGIADVYLLMARTSNEGSKGITSFLVPKDTPGFRIGKEEKKLGLLSSTLCELIFEDCFLPDALRIGDEGEGLAVALSQLDSGRLGIAACGLGVAIEALVRTWTTLLDDKTLEVGFAEGVQNRFAEHYAKIQSVKSLLWDVADLKDAGERVTVLASHVKLLASDLAMEVTSDAVEFLGFKGYTKEYEVERLMRDAKALQIVEGTNQIQRLVISREMTKMLRPSVCPVPS